MFGNALFGKVVISGKILSPSHTSCPANSLNTLTSVCRNALGAFCQHFSHGFTETRSGSNLLGPGGVLAYNVLAEKH